MYCHFVSILLPFGLSAVILRFIILSTVILSIVILSDVILRFIILSTVILSITVLSKVPADNASTIILYANLLINEQFFRSFQLELKKYLSLLNALTPTPLNQHIPNIDINTLDKMSVNEMTVDKMTYCHVLINIRAFNGV